MGAGNIIENNIREATTKIWDQVPAISDKSWLQFDLTKYNKSFVNFAVVIGALTLAKSTLSLAGLTLKVLSKAAQPVPTSTQLHDRYGYHSWALIADCAYNEQYCKFLAKNGFNLILMGDEKDVLIAKEQAQNVNRDILIDTVLVDWPSLSDNLKIYEQLIQKYKNTDISILVLPKLTEPRDNLPSHVEHIQPFTHNYMLVRYFGQKLKWRSYMSAIIFPSHYNYEEVTPHNGISKALIAGNDAFGRIINFEMRGNMDIVVARGGVENAFKGLGKEVITY